MAKLPTIPTYDFVIDSNYDEVYAISLVDEGAIERDFVAFDKQEKIKVELQAIDEEKRIVLGPVLIPEKLIYRRDDYGNEWNVKFSKKVIEQLSQRFLQNFNQKNITLGHEFGVENVSVVETWIKASTNDKSSDYGFSDLPNGTWFVAMKVDSDVVWENVKKGIVNAFSVEAWLSMVETEMRKQTELSAEKEVDYSELLSEIEGQLNPKKEEVDYDELYNKLEDIVKGED